MNQVPENHNSEKSINLLALLIAFLVFLLNVYLIVQKHLLFETSHNEDITFVLHLNNKRTLLPGPVLLPRGIARK